MPPSRVRGGGAASATSSAGVGTRPGAGGAPSRFALVVLDLVDAIPPGCVMTYGDIAEALGTRAPRQVGQVLSRHGREVPWQRVVLATGDPAPNAPEEALRLLKQEGCPLTEGGRRVDMARARWRGPLPDRLLPASHEGRDEQADPGPAAE